jgi:hypothetical protein
MATPVSRVQELVDRWFRALDQRPIRVGLQEWLLQVTGIWVEGNEVWIQLADRSGPGGSILLHVDSATSIDQAIRALSGRGRGVYAQPQIVSVSSVAQRQEQSSITESGEGVEPAAMTAI